MYFQQITTLESDLDCNYQRKEGMHRIGSDCSIVLDPFLDVSPNFSHLPFLALRDKKTLHYYCRIDTCRTSNVQDRNYTFYSNSNNSCNDYIFIKQVTLPHLLNLTISLFYYH